MPELGRVSRQQAAALAGLAPYDDDSGKHKGQRHIAGGRRRLRRSLFAAALPAAFRWNKALIELYARLIARGKAHNAALIACARKLLIYANTVIQRGTPWTEKPRASLMVATVTNDRQILSRMPARQKARRPNSERSVARFVAAVKRLHAE
jgi:transposase